MSHPFCEFLLKTSLSPWFDNQALTNKMRCSIVYGGKEKASSGKSEKSWLSLIQSLFNLCESEKMRLEGCAKKKGN